MAPTDYTITCNATGESGQVWFRWITTDSSIATGTVTTASTWTDWNSGWIVHPLPQFTAEEVAAGARRLEEERQRLRARQEQEQLANDRAEALLRAHLNAEQLAQLEAKRYFELELISNKARKRYRIERGQSQNILQLDDSGKPIRRFCVVAAARVPVADQMLMQKLMLEYEEDRFLKTANSMAA